MKSSVYKVCTDCSRLNSYESEYVIPGPAITIVGRSYMPAYLLEEADKKTVVCKCGKTVKFTQPATV